MDSKIVVSKQKCIDYIKKKMTINGQFFYIIYAFSFFLKVDPKCIYLEEKILLNHLNSVFLGHTKVTNGHRMYLDGDGKR